jgi:hypothetical protein
MCDVSDQRRENHMKCPTATDVDLTRDSKTYIYVSKRSDKEFTGKLQIYWEVDYDSFSDQYDVEEISCYDLLRLWYKRVIVSHPSRMVPIYWYVVGDGKFEALPNQPWNQCYGWDERYRTYESDTLMPINWGDLRIVDKYWTIGGSIKGGFLQSATGWKPSYLQPTVFADGLLRLAEAREIRG